MLERAGLPEQKPTEEKIKTFKLHWLDGREEEINGTSISDAFTRAGYGGGAQRALDYWKELEEKEEE